MADLFDTIPSLDLHQFTQGDEEQKAQFVDQLGDAFHRIGFVAIKNHGLTDELTEKLYTTVKEFFALPEEAKKQYDRPELHGQRGYTSKGKEHAKGRTTAD
ncbi:MAG: 2-oxoglutarate and iron-dependent oxygenase domain-containing protein, partial [Bacteroidota bacterium]